MDSLTNSQVQVGPRFQQYLSAVQHMGGMPYLNDASPAVQRGTLTDARQDANQVPVDSYQSSTSNGLDTLLQNLRRAANTGWGQ